MRHANSCIESLERRMLLNAAIEVWAGNTNPGSLSYDQSVEQLGYTRIGESNAANASIAFNSSANYKYFFIATRGRVQVDSIRSSAGTYVSQINWESNVLNASAATGASNNVYATVGTEVSESEFAGGMLVVAPSTWTGLTVKTGKVEVMFDLRVELQANYMQGASTPYGYNSQLQVQHHGLVTSARVHTPAGRWFDLSPKHEGDGDQTELQWERFYGSKAAMDAELGDGIYTVSLQTILGATSYSFNGSGVAFPTQRPSTTSLTHGKTNTPTTVNIVLPSITDASVTNVSMWISSSNEDEVYNSYFTPGSGSLEQVVLSPADSYNASLRFGADKRIWNADGYGANYQKSNEIGLVFATVGFTQETPDLQNNSFTAPATLNPGDTFMLSLSVSSTGGILVGSGAAPKQPLTHVMGLSTNKIIGDADDLILLTGIDVGEMAGWQFAGDMSVQIPYTAMPGKYFVFGSLDAKKVATEASETNNIKWSSAAVITIPPQAITLDPVTRRLSIAGTGTNDTIKVTVDGKTVHASIGTATRSFAKSSITSIYINGNAGNDKITVGNGMTGVTLYGGDGNDTIYSGSGNDVIYGNGGDDRIFSQDGADSVYAGLGADSLDGGAGNDSLIAGDQSDTVRGGIGNDYIEGKGKADTLYGGAGNDTILGGSGSNAIYGEDGDDRIYALNSLSFRDTISGGTGTDGAQRESNDVLSSIEQNILV